MIYKKRHLERKILEYLKIFPVVTLTGSRQSGKSTLLKHIFTRGWNYYSLDERGLLETIRNDPDLFVKSQKSNFILDEAQKLPDIFHSIKHAVDQGYPHKIILSGSANFLLMSQITETLAGRAGVLELYPFSYSELNKKSPPGFLQNILRAKSVKKLMNYPATSRRGIKSKKEYGILASYGELNPLVGLQLPQIKTGGDLVHDIFYGGYPKVRELSSHSSKTAWFENYRTTYLERDLRDLAQVASISDFQRFYEMLAYQTGSLLNLSNTGRDVGITTNTCKKYFSILVSSYQYFALQPFYANMRKRLIKTPKVYAWDTGLINFLLKYRNQDELLNSGKYGNIFENWIVTELLKQNFLMNEKANFYFWRTSNGAEVDLVIEFGQKIIPIEIKSTSNLRKETLKGLFNFMENMEGLKEIPFGLVLYRGERVMQLSRNIIALPVESIFA